MSASKEEKQIQAMKPRGLNTINTQDVTKHALDKKQCTRRTLKIHPTSPSESLHEGQLNKSVHAVQPPLFVHRGIRNGAQHGQSLVQHPESSFTCFIAEGHREAWEVSAIPGHIWGARGSYPTEIQPRYDTKRASCRGSRGCKCSPSRCAPSVHGLNPGPSRKAGTNAGTKTPQ